LASHIDITPTLLDAAGVAAPPPMHGRSLLDLYRAAPPWREALLCESAGLEFGLYSQRMVRRGDYKLIYNCYDRTELYDLRQDPHELTNLAYRPELAQLRLDLEAELAFLMADCDDPLAGVAAAVLG
jgi:arylsulfatase A-like enzyme